MIEKMAYVIANPVKAGLVEKAQDWPGITFLPRELGRRKLMIRRPEGLFDSKSEKWPATIELRLTLPPTLENAYPCDEIRRSVAMEVSTLEADAKADLRRRGRRAAGSVKVRRFSPFARARSLEDSHTLNPTFAVGSGQTRALLEALREVREFRRAYRSALQRWREGLRTVVFPEGTWLMKQLHGAAT